MSNITVETATVYKGGGRRWFTKGAALRAEAKLCFRKVTATKDRCECGETYIEHFGDIPDTCKYHENTTRRSVRDTCALQCVKFNKKA